MVLNTYLSLSGRVHSQDPDAEDLHRPGDLRGPAAGRARLRKGAGQLQHQNREDRAHRYVRVSPEIASSEVGERQQISIRSSPGADAPRTFSLRCGSKPNI